MSTADPSGLHFSTYSTEESLPEIIALIQKDLSEPYSVFTYRYFVNRFPTLCEMVRNDSGELVAKSAIAICPVLANGAYNVIANH
jgi:hypothetical protein